MKRASSRAKRQSFQESGNLFVFNKATIGSVDRPDFDSITVKQDGALGHTEGFG